MPTHVETILFKILGDSKGGERAFDRINKRLTTFGAALTAASDAALVAFAKLGESGAKIEALETRFGRMASAFGQSADEMLGSWDKAAAGTIDRISLMEKANQAALLGLPVDRLAEMLEIARRAAESTGKDINYMFESLVLGVARKSRVVLDNLGIIVSAEEAYATYAKSIGKAANQLTAQEQQIAFMEAAFAAAARQEQILGENTETMATVMARARAKFKDAGNEIKKAFAPVVARAAALLTKLINIFLAIPQPIKQALATILAIAAAIGAIVGPILTIVGMWPVISTALAAVGGVIGSVAPAILAVVAVLGVLAAAIKILVKAWKQDWGGIQTTVMNVIEKVRPYLTMLIRNIQGWMATIRAALASVAKAVRDLVEPAMKALASAFENNLGGIKTFLMFLRDLISVVMSTVVKILTAIRLVLTGNADKAWKPLEDAALNVLTIIVMAWRKYIRKAVVWGWNLVVNIANGIIRAARTVLVSAANFIGNMLANFLAPGSPPKMGVLRGIVEWGKGLIDTYLRGFALADFGILRDTLAPIRDALQAAVDLGDMDQVEMLTVFREVRQQAASLIADFRRTGVINEEIMAGIAQRLGEGGEEYTKYLRLTLEHQKALENLNTVQEEVAEAERRGFIPAELKAKLRAAEDEVDAKAEAVDWQREYLAALQEGVDLQREMIEALKELTKATKAAKEGPVSGELAPLAPGVTTAKVKFEGFGGFSAEFEKTKEEIRQWFAELPNKIKLWLARVGLAVIVWLQRQKARLIGWFYRLLLSVGRWEYETLLKVGKWLYETQLKIEAFLATARLWVVTKLAGIRAQVGLFFTKLRIKVRQKFDELKNTLRIKWLEIKLWVDGRIEALKETLTGAIDDIKTIGGNIAGGLWQGMKDKWAEIKAWWERKMAWLHGSAEDELETNSPSRVFYRIGQSVGEGYIRGVNDRLAGAMRGAFGGIAAQGLATAGGLHVDQLVVALPNVTDGFNAEGITDYLQSLSDQASLRAEVPGGVMG